MTIALPPPITPQLVSAAEMRTENQHELVVEYQGIHIHVFDGIRRVDEGRLGKAISDAANISDAIRAIGNLYYMAGYPATLVSYVVNDAGNLNVRIVPAHVKKVTGPGELTGFFTDLEKQASVTEAALENDRALAELSSGRSGKQYRLEFLPDSGSDVVLNIVADPASENKQTLAGLSFSNYGNRYAGPDLATGTLQYSFSGGDAVSLTAATSVKGSGGSSKYHPYWEADGQWSHVASLGVFGVEGRYADFRQTVQGTSVRGTLNSAAATWLYPLYTDFHQHLTVQGKFEHSHTSVDAPSVSTSLGTGNPLLDLLNGLLGLNATPSAGSGGKLLTERYNSIEFTLGYTTALQLNEHQTDVQAAFSVRKGLGPSSSSTTLAKLDYLLWKPSVTVRYQATPNWSYLGDAGLQFSNDRVPQQQQFVIGGPASLHAYETGVGLGDHGGNLRLATEWKDDEGTWLERYSIRPQVFVEYATSAFSHPTTGIPAGSVDLADAGIETGIRFTSWLSGNVSFAQSVYKKGEANSPDGLAKQSVFFLLSGQY